MGQIRARATELLSPKISEVSVKPIQVNQGDSGNLRTHTIIQADSPIVTTVGGSKNHENRPPYYALAFIMRTL